MKKLILILLIVILSSCNLKENYIPIGPFIVEDVKIIRIDSRRTKIYRYQIRSHKYNFTYIKSKKRFHAGDTLTLTKLTNRNYEAN